MISARMQPNLSMKTPALVLALLSIMFAAEARSIDDTDTARIDLKAFFQHYRTADTAALRNFQLPSVWIYNPEGQLVVIITSASDILELDNLLKSPLKEAISTVDLEQLSGILAEAGAVVPAPAERQWTALLLSSDGCETSCRDFRSNLNQARQRSGRALQVLDLTLNR